ncbi:16S rRNA (guanine(527)-N(7))-methyltransferase RsmG [Shimia biformata]|uniref:16S rRNA (guanine(527)-N(7))-methyltransferase RsmG n=1 Tax=Shimia biformata TaxID=1294299 RepID=UPI00195042AB|nr:16S rRNA (guanine(527)-N(7))-methyltransferase RsmG [Shimia biformata]
MRCPTDIAAALNVSRETLDRLEKLAELLQKWNPKINLVSKSTLSQLWARHILDSAQVFKLGRDVVHWVDIGSGGGFPGLVIALMKDEQGAPKRVTMIESDQRKCAFLRTVLRETGCEASILDQRIEKAPPQAADILSARALADLSVLCGFAERHLGGSGQAVFPKGANWQKEVALAQESWSFDLDVIQSKTEPEAVILKLGAIQRV